MSNINKEELMRGLSDSQVNKSKQDFGTNALAKKETESLWSMFIGAFDLAASWSEDGVKGCRRFLDRVWKLQDLMTDEEGYSKDLETKMHQTIKKVSFDYENLKYNS